jgi:hypothetical protein
LGLCLRGCLRSFAVGCGVSALTFKDILRFVGVVPFLLWLLVAIAVFGDPQDEELDS